MTQKKTLYIGVLIFIIGILLRWFIESLVSPDGDIQTPILVFVIALLQTVAIVNRNVPHHKKTRNQSSIKNRVLSAFFRGIHCANTS